MASSFFKVLLDPSADHLSLPPAFVKKHMENKVPNTAIIRSANGGYSWRLKIQQIGDNYCFANGWNNVVKDIHLGFGDFLLFRLVDQSTFTMSIYSPNACEKVLPDQQNYDYDYEKNEENSDEDPFFTSVITATHKNLLRFPEGFAELAGIDAEGTMTLKNLDGKEWVMGLRLDKVFKSTNRYFLSAGWALFARENDLSEGDECVFRFIRSEDKLLLAKVVKKKCTQQLCEKFRVAKRSRDRVTHVDCSDVDEDVEEERVELKGPVEMPCKRRCGPPPQEKSRVIFF